MSEDPYQTKYRGGFPAECDAMLGLRIWFSLNKNKVDYGDPGWVITLIIPNTIKNLAKNLKWLK